MSPDEIKQATREVLAESHMALAKVQSDFFGIITKELQDVKEYQKQQNGRTAKHSEKIEEMNATLEDFTSKFKGAVWAISFTGAALIALTGIIWQQINQNIDKTSDLITQHIMQSK